MSGPPSRVLPTVGALTAGAVAGALTRKPSGGGSGPPRGAGASVSVDEGAAEIIGNYSLAAGRPIATGERVTPPAPKPAPIEEAAPTPAADPDGRTVKLGDLEQFLKIQHESQDGCAGEDFNPGKFLRENTTQTKLSSYGLAAKALGGLAAQRAPKR